MKNVTTIKEVNTSAFVISLVEANSKYYVVYGRASDAKVTRSEPISDYRIADYYFELKMKDMLVH